MTLPGITPLTLRARLSPIAYWSAMWLALGSAPPIAAQGITTAAIRGTVRTQDGALVQDADVRVVNDASGVANVTRVRGGTFLVQGLETGGPYRIVVRRVGYAPSVQEGVELGLGERFEVAMTLLALGRELDTVGIVTRRAKTLPSAGGVGTTIGDSLLRRLPTLNRDLNDFARFTPQAGSRFGLSGGGASIRLNSFVIDGVTDRQLQNNNPLGGATGGKTISIEAVKEYQVLLSPYDARYGDFTGMLVNAITKSGTNTLHGSAYGYVRNADLARGTSFLGSSPFERQQYGFVLGGPIVRDRAHFFVATEWQHAAAPALGPYVGSLDAASHVDSSLAADIARFAETLERKGLAPGDGGRVILHNPNASLFGRVDVALPELRSRLVLRENYSGFDQTQFARSSSTGAFPLTSTVTTLGVTKRTTALQLFTQLSTGVFNELLVASSDSPINPSHYTYSPSIQVSAQSNTASLTAGPVGGGVAGTAQSLIEVGDHLVFQSGVRHTISVGAHAEFFVYHTTGLGGAFGQWRFQSLDSLSRDQASSYILTKDFGAANTAVRGSEPSAYVSDEWRVSERLSVTMGLRGDALVLHNPTQYNPAVDTIFHRRTDEYPATHIQWSPRLGLLWQPGRDGRTRVRGGAGFFVGRPPLGWLLGPVRSNGTGVQTLQCGPALGASGRVPVFVPDAMNPPNSCAGGRGFSAGAVTLTQRSLRMPESFRTSLAVDRQLPWDMHASVEALYSRMLSDFAFVNARLAGPQGTDAHGRVLYGGFSSSGAAVPVYLDTNRFTEVIDVRNRSNGYSSSVTARLDKAFASRLELHAAYTYSRVRDVRSLTSASSVAPLTIWASGKPLSGRQDDMTTGVSSYDIPHRVVIATTFAMHFKGLTTDISLSYIGESGTPFTYVDSAVATGLGDLNADGTNANDPIYVPRDASDASEFAPADAQSGAAFERFIRNTPCLRRQRGQILARNSCRSPWVHTSNAALRQSLPALGGRSVSLQLEVFNVLNLLNASWGLVHVPNPAVLQHVGQTAGSVPQPVFRFNAATATTFPPNAESGYQLQLSLRIAF